MDIYREREEGVGVAREQSNMSVVKEASKVGGYRKKEKRRKWSLKII